MDWKTRIEAVKVQLNLKDDALAELLGITTRTLLDLRKGLKDPTGPVQRLLEVYGAQKDSVGLGAKTSLGESDVAGISGALGISSALGIIPSRGGAGPIRVLRGPLHLVLMHGEFELGDGRNKYDAILAMHSAVGRKTEYHYITSPLPNSHSALIVEGLVGRGMTPHFLKDGDVGSRDCQFSAIAMWLVAQAMGSGLASVTIAASPRRFRALAQTIRQYAQVEVTVAYGHSSGDEAEVCRSLSAEGVMTADVDGRRFGVLVEGQSQRVFGAPVGTTAEGAETRALEIDSDGNGHATIPLEAGQIRRIASGTPEFEYAKLGIGDLVSYSVGISPAGAGAIDVALLKSAASDSLMGNLRVGLARGMRLFTDDNSPETLRCVREAIATCATKDGWASFEYVWNRLYLLAKAGRGWDPGENGEGLVALAQRHRSAFELDGEGAVPARIKVRGLGM